MAPLKNPKHEMFARKVIKYEGNISKAYKENYPDSKDYDIIRASASHLFARKEVRNRVAELLDRSGLDIASLNNKLQHLVNAKKKIPVRDKLVEVEDNSTQLSSITLAYKLHGCMNNVQGNTFNIQNNMNNVVNTVGNMSESIKELRKITQEIQDLGVIDGKVPVERDIIDTQVVDNE